MREWTHRVNSRRSHHYRMVRDGLPDDTSERYWWVECDGVRLYRYMGGGKHLFVIPQNPVSKKNSRQIVMIPSGAGKKRPISVPSARVKEANKRWIPALKGLVEGAELLPVCTSINAAIQSVCRCYAEELPDSSNLYQWIEDAFQESGVIQNDQQIVGHDGSSRVALCDVCELRPVYKRGPKEGQYKRPCGMTKTCELGGIIITLTEGVSNASIFRMANNGQSIRRCLATCVGEAVPGVSRLLDRRTSGVHA